MADQRVSLRDRIESGQKLLLAEIRPPTSGQAAPLRQAAQALAGKVHAVGVSDNRDGVRMSALAAASLVAAEGAEPILHVVTRDRNRIALVSDYLGAQAMGIANVLCTTGTHQTLGRYRAAKNVFDVDSIQLLQMYRRLPTDASIVGETQINGAAPLCLGAVTSPFADPMEMQWMRLAKKVSAGAQFVITAPVFDVERFQEWFAEVAGRGLHQRTAIVAGIGLLGDAEQARALAASRPSPRVPEDVLDRIASAPDAAAQRAAAMQIAVETIQQLSELDGLRGFQIDAADDIQGALEIIDNM